MSDTIKPSWVESTLNPFFTLSPAKISEALESVIGIKKDATPDANADGKSNHANGIDDEGKSKRPSGLTIDQELYSRALLLNASSTGATIMEEEARLNDALASRKLSPAYSVARVGVTESALYDLIDAGKVDEVKSIVKTQQITATAHPNFSRSREIVKKSGELSRALGKLSRHDQKTLEETGQLPLKSAEKITEILIGMKEKIEPRTARNRHAELEETAIDLIPKAMDAATEVVKIFKQRKRSLSGELPLTEKRGGAINRSGFEGKRTISTLPSPPRKFTFSAKKIEVDGNTVDVPARTVDVKGVDIITSDGTLKNPEFTSVKQLEAVATLFPEYNSWFLDGDGKRSCHVYDAELAIPAIKRATYEEYSKLLDKLPEKIGDFDKDYWKRKFTRTISMLKEVEDLAADRMQAFNDLHDANEVFRKDTYARADSQRNYHSALKFAKEASFKYKKKVAELDPIENKTIYEILRDEKKNGTEESLSDSLKAQLGKELDKIYNKEIILDPSQKEAVEDLYMKLHAYGNYAVHLQRRENFEQYTIIFDYLVSNNSDSSLKKNLSKNFGIDEDELTRRLKNPDFYLQAVEAVTKSAMSPEDPLQVRMHTQNTFKHVAKTLEDADDIFKPGATAENMVVTPLEDRAFRTLDGLGCFHMAKLYPEAFKGGFIVAEFAQPDIEILERDDGTAARKNEVRNEVVRLAKRDMLLQLAYSSAMEAPKNIAIIPLHEDPSTMEYIPAAQAALREGPFLDYLKQFIGVETKEEADKKALHYLNDEGKPEMLTAYQHLRRYGFNPDEIKGVNVEELKHLPLLEGPFDMEACSDNNKRSTTMGSVLAEQSIRDKILEAVKHPIEIDGKKYAVIKPKYLGQGGSIARATKIPIDTEQATWQGEHLSNLVPEALAQESYNKLLGRLFLRHQSAKGENPSQELYDLAAAMPFHTSNILGFTEHNADPAERRLIDYPIKARIDSTRDDMRYNAFLNKYGEPALNYSARTDSKDGKDEFTFSKGRAIGLAAKEAGIFSNIIGVVEAFEFGREGQLDRDTLEKITKWKNKDPYVQHLLTAGALAANFVNLKEKWKRGGITYQEPEGGVEQNGYQPAEIMLRKEEAEVSLKTLVDAYKGTEIARDRKSIPYERPQRKYKDPKTGAIFDAGDLVMAHLTDQYHRLVQALHAVYPGKKTLLDIFPEEYHDTIKAYKDIYDTVLSRLPQTEEQKTQLAKINKKDEEDRSSKEKRLVADRQLLEGTYYILFESGGGMFPMPSLLEQRLQKNPNAKFENGRWNNEQGMAIQ